jgi:GDP-4-dehydro-6-deoxy-D-mannose reductase
MTAGLDTPLVVNVASGHSTAIRDVLAHLCRIAGVEAKVRVDAALVRPVEPPEVVGNPALLGRLTGWRPEISLEQTLEDAFARMRGPTAAG